MIGQEMSNANRRYYFFTWLTAMRSDGEQGIFDWCALLVSLSIGAIEGIERPPLRMLCAVHRGVDISGAAANSLRFYKKHKYFFY